MLELESFYQRRALSQTGPTPNLVPIEGGVVLADVLRCSVTADVAEALRVSYSLSLFPSGLADSTI